jgi:hypothetical protein
MPCTPFASFIVLSKLQRTVNCLSALHNIVAATVGHFLYVQLLNEAFVLYTMMLQPFPLAANAQGYTATS